MSARTKSKNRRRAGNRKKEFNFLGNGNILLGHPWKITLEYLIPSDLKRDYSKGIAKLLIEYSPTTIDNNLNLLQSHEWHELIVGSDNLELIDKLKPTCCLAKFLWRNNKPSTFKHLLDRSCTDHFTYALGECCFVDHKLVHSIGSNSYIVYRNLGIAAAEKMDPSICYGDMKRFLHCLHDQKFGKGVIKYLRDNSLNSIEWIKSYPSLFRWDMDELTDEECHALICRYKTTSLWELSDFLRESWKIPNVRKVIEAHFDEYTDLLSRDNREKLRNSLGIK